MEFTYCDLWKFYSCDLCPYRTTSLLTITNHMRQHRTAAGPAPFTCDVDVAQVSYKCEVCGFESPLKVNLGNHVNIIHKKLHVKYDYVDILRNFTCGSCDFQSHSFLLLTKHAWTCTSKDELVVLMRSHKGMVKCKLCYFVAHDKSLMKKHREFIHPKGLRNKHRRPKVCQLPAEQLRPKIYQIPVEQLKDMYVTHRNAFMNTYRNDQNSVPYRSNLCTTSMINGQDGDKASEILLIPLKVSSVKYGKPSRKWKQLLRPVQLDKQGDVSSSNCQTPEQQPGNISATQGATSREHHPGVVAATQEQHLDNICARQGEASASTNREQHPVQHPDVYSAPEQHLSSACAVHSQDCCSTNPEQHPEVPTPTNQVKIWNRLVQLNAKEYDPSLPYCLSDITKTYQCKYCSFNTQFKVLINYHENVLHKNLKIKWDLIRIFQDFECPCCQFETASRLVLMKHNVDKHFMVCKCCNLSHLIND